MKNPRNSSHLFYLFPFKNERRASKTADENRPIKIIHLNLIAPNILFFVRVTQLVSLRTVCLGFEIQKWGKRCAQSLKIAWESFEHLKQNVFDIFPHVSGSSDEGETAGVAGGGGGEDTDIEENSARPNSTPVYRDPRPLHATSAHDVPQEYNPQTTAAFQQEFTAAAMERPTYEKPPQPMVREDDPWGYDKSDRKNYVRAVAEHYRTEYREFLQSSSSSSSSSDALS